MTAFASSLATTEAREILRPHVARLEALLKAYTVRRAAEQPEAEREKYWLLADNAVERFLSDSYSEARERSPEEEAWVAESARLTRDTDVLKCYSLTRVELDILLLSALPNLDFRFRHWFQLLQGDPARSHLSVWRALDILEPSLKNAGEARAVFHPESTLRRFNLIFLEHQDEGLLSAIVHIDDRIIAHLLGSDELDVRLTSLLTLSQQQVLAAPDPRLDIFCEYVKMQIFQGEPVRVLLQSPDTRRTQRAAQAFARAAKQTLLEFDCARGMHSSVPWPLLVDLALREARLHQAAILFRNAAALLVQEPPGPQSAVLVEAIASHPGLTIAEVQSTSTFPQSVFIPIILTMPSYEDRVALWSAALKPEVAQSESIAEHLAASFLLTEDQIDSALAAARNLARRDGPFSGSLTPEVLFEACRHQTGKRLVAMAQRLEPRPGLTLDAVVLPPPNFRQLEELRNRIRHRREVHSAMGFEHRLRLGRGLMALFAGPSGTGKTMAAEVLASERRCDLYKVDLSSVISKWVGETEKNLNRIFDEAENCQGMLFFDEADALFGQRGEVKEARDRWANLEVNFLLQRIEEFSGVVILATNLRSNIDPAFSRRFHSVVDFPQPDEHARLAIWKRTLPGEEFVSLDEREMRLIAARFDLSGGMIRNAVLDASYRAIEAGGKIGLRQVTAAAAREYQKIARPVTRSEFGDSLYQIALEEVLAPS